jgi:hypothetical protein
MEIFHEHDIPMSLKVISSLDKRRNVYKKVGWLYVAKNSGLSDPYLKIGMTSKYPSHRMNELSRSTSIPTHFDLIYYVHVGHINYAEQHAHKLLSDYRVSRRKEFFDTTISNAINALDAAAKVFPLVIYNGKTVASIVEQDLVPNEVVCSSCHKNVRVHTLLIKIKVKCKNCGSIINF